MAFPSVSLSSMAVIIGIALTAVAQAQGIGVQGHTAAPSRTVPVQTPTPPASEADLALHQRHMAADPNMGPMTGHGAGSQAPLGPVMPPGHVAADPGKK